MTLRESLEKQLTEERLHRVFWKQTVDANLNTGRAFADVSASWAETFLGTVTSSTGIVWHVFSGKAELP